MTHSAAFGVIPLNYVLFHSVSVRVFGGRAADVRDEHKGNCSLVVLKFALEMNESDFI